MGLIEWIDERYYAGVQKNWDDLYFRKLILEKLTPDAKVLDLGAGAGIVAQMNFRGRAARICGVDPDIRVIHNPYLDEGKQGSGESIPYPDEAFDMVFADNVLEHLEMPSAVFGEVARVLKPGGIFLVKTPNRRHYMPLIARMTPHGFHQWVNRKRGRKEVDTFPTRYLANTPMDLQCLAGKAELIVESIRLVEGRPEYLRFLAPAYVFGLLYERLVNSTEILAPFRILIVAVFYKPTS